MKALFIGGTGTISSAITKQLAEKGCELYLLIGEIDRTVCLKV
jgi:predicted amino acid dehydrogenase